MSERCDVLVIDDESVVRDAVQLVLGAEGFTVTAVDEAEAALADPALETCRLIVCDLMLPGVSGLETVRSIRRRRPEVPIVVITGYPTDENIARAVAAGATEVVAKPFDDLELLERTRHALARADVAGEEGPP